MRFGLAHKTASYLMVAAAFLGLVSGGGVSPLVSLLGLVGLVASWWWEPPRVRLERWALWWTIASIGVLAWGALTAVATADYFGAAGTFLVWLTVAKAFNRRTSRDWQQLYLLSFLMLVAGSVFNDGLGFAAAFLGFVVASTWALILGHLRREMEDNFLLKHADDRSERVEVRRILESRRIVGGRFFAGTGAVSLGVFALSALIFLSLPRIGAGFFMQKRDGLTFAGFRDGVKLGGHGTIKDNDTVVMRVEIDAPFRGRDAPYLHWRAVAFDEYSKGEWRRSRSAPMTLDIDDRPAPGRTRRHLLYDQFPRGRADVGALDARLDGAVKQTIWIEPLGSEALFAASMPLAFEHDAVRARRRWERNDEIRLPREGPVRYTAWSAITPRDPAALRAAPDRLPAGYDVFLQLPPEITARTRALAREITAGATTAYDRAVAIETWLRTELAYTLELEDPGGAEPVDFFLFERRRGHCEYFASAFAVLARAVDVPVRQVNGFLGGEWNEYDGYIAVRAGDAHSWNEVYFAGVGWVTFDATPASQDQLGRGGTGLGARLRRWVDTLRFQWSKWVIDYDLHRQLDLFRGVGGSLKDAGRWVGARWRAVKAFVKRHAWAAALVVLAIAAVVIARARRRRRGGDAAAGPTRPRPRSPVAVQYARVLARLEKRGVPRAAAQTPRELARAVAARGAPWAAALGELTELYHAARWGHDDDPALLARARALADEIEAALAGDGARADLPR